MDGLVDMSSKLLSAVTGQSGGETQLSPKAGTNVLSSVNFTESRVLESFPVISQTKLVIPIGREYFNKKRHIAGEPIIESSATSDEDHTLNEGAIVIPPNITPDNLDQFTYYEILGLSTFGDSADRHLIRKAYHKAVLLYHPDKMHSHGHSEEECRAIFLKVQAAADTLTDSTKRRAYDSLLDFDESIPTEAEAKEASLAGIEAFLEIFEPVFQRNARFALRKPVPGIGSPDTSIMHVNNFYSYWVKFDSWRDFTNVDREHDPEQAQSREHKRWMQKENEKNAKKLKKIEMARLNELVTRALAHDPRILADKARVKAEKAALKEERQKKAAEEEREKAEKAKQLEEEQLNKIKNEKINHEKARKQASKARNTFRKLLRIMSSLGLGDVGGEFGLMTSDDCDVLCKSTETRELVELNEKMGGDAAVSDSNACVATAVDDVLAHLQSVKKAIEDKKLEELKQTELRKKDYEKNALASSLKKKGVNREWSVEEFSMLSKGIRKFPAGTRQRWVTISNFMNDMLKPAVPYEKEECLQASQNAMKIMANLQDSSVQKASTQPLPPAPSTAATVTPIAKTAPQKVAQAKSVTSAADSNMKPKAELDSKSGKNKAENGASNDSEVWTQNEQKLLENGLKKYPASMDKNERWTAIAADIPGKTKKDCIMRFKKLREELQASKTKK